MNINEKTFQKMNTTMLGETAYRLKHIEKGKLKAYKNCGMYYVIQSDLDKYILKSKNK